MSFLFFKAKDFSSGRSLPQLNEVNDLIPKYEDDAYGHWLFGGGPSSLVDVVNGRILTLQSGATVQPIYADKTVTLSTAIGNALLTDLVDSSAQSLTLCAVVKCTTTALAILLGNLVPGTSTTSSGLGAFASAGKGYLTVKPVTANGSAGIPSLSPPSPIIQTSNFFIATSINKNTKKGVVYIQQAGAESSNEASYTASSYEPSANKIGIGNVAYATGGNTTIYSEAIVFDKALTLAEIQAVALRSKDRMANRNISF
ncbi:hypothetical protein [Acinetobacter baumannii]|uniref:hypothetical protein n=1 Tax=Acinetobacter baumannii TaxID=470 RepID=UPI001C0DEE79|nr:hypothetical protein [Acinetobacter baumannii]MBU3079627.1 hypothetical protein [Acinetobacter baumannii]MDC4516455.1 hypothetical protein [Acinetobacter baumannii]MDC5136790.1 hypothetical protein [Acinetobacter baumannii]MDC5230941.1 hypothetical protein [Acinetobacter baumannii]HEO1767954.1 hypothetical protein [Acinetobacter baumannii]